MECKFNNSPFLRGFCWHELIDTLWNVNNLYPLNLWQNGAQELIDTLWNVNLSKNTIKSASYPELIDTLWNVNEKENLDQMADRLQN